MRCRGRSAWTWSIRPGLPFTTSLTSSSRSCRSCWRTPTRQTLSTGTRQPCICTGIMYICIMHWTVISCVSSSLIVFIFGQAWRVQEKGSGLRSQVRFRRGATQSSRPSRSQLVKRVEYEWLQRRRSTGVYNTVLNICCRPFLFKLRPYSLGFFFF